MSSHGESVTIGQGDRLTADNTASANYTYDHLRTSVNVGKTPNGQKFTPGSLITYTLTYTNNGERPITDPVFTDNITPVDGVCPLMWDPDQDPTVPPWSFGLSGTATTNGGPDLPTAAGSWTADDPLSVGDCRVSFTPPSGTVLEVGQTLTITLTMMVRPGVEAHSEISNDAEIDIAGPRDPNTGKPLNPPPPLDTCNGATVPWTTPANDSMYQCDYDVTNTLEPGTAIAAYKAVKADVPPSTLTGVTPTKVPGDVMVRPDYLVSGGGTIPDAQKWTYCLDKADDAGYYRNPCVPVTIPGDTETWKFDIENVGTMPVTQLVSVDVLPYVGDKGVIVQGDRLTEWHPIFTGTPVLVVKDANGNTVSTGTLTVDYSSGVAVCAAGKQTPGSPNTSACGLNDWAPLTSTGDNPDVLSLRFTMNFDAALAPGQTAEIQFQTRTLPEDLAPDGWPIAWNTVATSGTATDPETGQDTALGATEVRKVGVTYPAGELDLSKMISGAGWNDENRVRPNYEAWVTCWIENGLNGSGYNAGVDELLNVPGNPYLLKPPNPLAPNTPGPIQSIKYLPFGAHCVVAEENTNREGTIYAPPSTLTPDQCPPVGDSWNGTEGLGVAGCSGEVIVGSPTYRPDVTLSVNNVYGESNATLTKSVDSDAVDQNGQPIKYGPFDFEIMCWQRDLDTQVLKNTLSDFHAPSCNPATTDCPPLWLPGQVKDGQTIATLEVIPPESYCEIREVNWATGLQTDWGATYDESPVGKGLTGDPWQQDGNTYSFPAWDVDPSQIDNTATPVPWPPGTITPGSDSRRIGFWTPLAQCGSDTQASDASQPNFCQEPPLAFTADNIMGDGMLTVTKDREGDGVSPYGNGPFDFHVVCTLDTDGVSTTPPVTVWQGDFTLPSGDPSLDTSWTWSQDHIATGASCTITETNTAGATTVAFDQNPVIIGDHGNPDAIPPIPANNPEVTVTVTNTFDAGALRINKKFTGDGGTLWGQGPWPDGTTPTYTVTSVCWTGGGNAPKPDLSNVIPPYLYGGPKFVLSAANNWDVVLSPLPDGAKCLFTETDQGGAQSVAISPNPVTVDGSHNCPTTITAAAETQEATNPSSPFADAGLTLVNTITVNDPSTCNPVDLNVTNEFTLGEIDVTKTVSGSASGLMNSNTEFEITLFCSYGGKTVNVPNSPATIKAGQTVKFTDLPTGTTCLIVETDSQGAQTTSVNPQFVTVGKSNTVKVAIDNTFDVGSLTINKLITGDDQAISDADADSTTFWVKLDCVWSGTPNPDGTPGPFPVPGSLWRQFKPGSPAVFKGLPIGAVCTISEGQFGQTSTTITPNPVTISSDPKRNVVIVTNDYQPSTLQIEKMVPTADTNPAYGNRPLDQDGNPIPYGPFELRLQCWKTEADYENWVATGNADLYPPIKDESVYVFDRPTTNSHWNVWDVAGVLPNSACLLTEFNRAGADDVQMMVRIDGDKGATWSDGDSLHFTMPESAVPVNVYVQNDYDSGSLTINKAIDGYGADAWGNGPFTFHVKCVADTGQGLTTVWDGNVTLGGDTSQAPWSTTIDHIALNAICTVTETGDGGANSTAVTTGDGSGVKPGATNEAQVAIVDATGSGPEVSVSFTNTFEVAGFSVTKEVMGPAAEDHLTDVFTAHVTCRYGLGSKAGQVIDTADLPDPYLFPDGSLQVAQNPSGSADYPLQPGQTLQFHDLPKGARCVLTEADDGGASSHWVNDITAGKPGVPANTSKPDQANITVGKDPLAAYQVDNSFGTGDLEVKKVIAGPGAGLYGAGPFEVTLSCVKDGQTVAPDSYGGAVRTLSAPDYSTKYGPFLPGTICTLKETETAGAHVVEYVPSPASNADQSASGEVTIEQDKTVGIRATNTYQVGSVEVTKTLSGTGADKYAPDSFTVKLACTWNGKSVSIPGGATRKIVAGKPVTYKNLPTGAECVLTETGSSGADAITYSPADAQNAKRARVVVGDGKAVSITVDNRFNNPTPPGGNPPGSGPYRPGGWQTITGVSATILLTAALTALLGVVFVTRPGLQTVPQRAGGRGRHRA
ncbi:MAG: DUF5979 domain-containing protein [Cellulomonadaceae bacterium]|nr:DUF5979 domain-containing protein [Cellulomonadaceae bacterium]